MIKQQLKLIGLALLLITSLYSKDMSKWHTFEGIGASGGKYRFTETYGQTDKKYNSDTNYTQRLDFTYSKRKGWQMYVTTSSVPGLGHTVLLDFIVDGKTYKHSHSEVFGKYGLSISKEFVEALKHTRGDIVLKESYTDGTDTRLDHTTVFKSKGLKKALEYINKVQ